MALNVDGRVSKGVYAAGWLATGPRGVIVDTMGTAFKVSYDSSFTSILRHCMKFFEVMKGTARF